MKRPTVIRQQSFTNKSRNQSCIPAAIRYHVLSWIATSNRYFTGTGEKAHASHCPKSLLCSNKPPGRVVVDVLGVVEDGVNYPACLVVHTGSILHEGWRQFGQTEQDHDIVKDWYPDLWYARFDGA